MISQIIFLITIIVFRSPLDRFLLITATIIPIVDLHLDFVIIIVIILNYLVEVLELSRYFRLIVIIHSITFIRVVMDQITFIVVPIDQLTFTIIIQDLIIPIITVNLGFILAIIIEVDLN